MNAARVASDKLNQQALTTAGTIGATGFIGPQLSDEQLKKAYENYNKVSDAAGAAKVANYDYAKSLKEGLLQALKDANGALDDAKKALTDYADTVAKGLLDAFSFKDAKDAGTETGGGFLSGLRAQVTGIKNYTNDVQKALNLGLSQDALAAVLAAGSDAGASIAAELVAGGKAAIDETNALVDSANMAAQKVGINAGTAWYQAGVDNAQKTVAGLQAEIDTLTPKMMRQMDKLANKLKRTVDVTVRVNEVVTRVTGGVMNTPTVAPISSRVSAQSAGDTTINITGGISTSAEIGESVVNAIRAYNRAAGPANIAVS
jgi:paraquat-inducible protein B